MLHLILFQGLTGLANAMFLFLTAAGLSLIFGVTRIINFAHGSFYMLAAYLTYSLGTLLAGTPWQLGVTLAVAPLAVALLGGLIEVILLRRVYAAPTLHQLLLTFALVLIFGDAVEYVWGEANLSVPIPALLGGSVRLLGQPFPLYYLGVIGFGPLMALLLWLLMTRTRWGILVRAATQDREMVTALGVNQKRLFTTVFIVGSWLAGFAGMLAAPMISVNPGMDTTVIVEAFVVAVIGGMGSFSGSLLGALLIGELKAFGILFFPRISLVLVFALMAVVLVARPWGLLGKEEPLTAEGGELAALQHEGLPVRWRPWLAVFLGLLLLPAVLPPFYLIILTELFAAALLAASLNFLLGYGGMISFGHAAYFGLGSYGAGLLVVRAGVGMPLAFLLAPLLALAGAALYGALSVRLSSIYFAMLTLAFAQITYTIAYQWYDLTGGDNGLLGIWPHPTLADPSVYYWFALGVTTLCLVALFCVVRSPFGQSLRAIRDNPLRAQSLGISTRLHQWIAFLMAGLFAGIAGALFVFQKGSTFPDYLSVEKSIEPLVMILLGGIGSLSGPLVGAAVFKLLDTIITQYTQYWQALLGGILVLLVVNFPRGIVGYVLQLWSRRGPTDDPDAAAPRA
ncbi:MAG: ABC transporter permease [Candidatus Tectomicrobia bacterium]|nr:ABC transporter permease [Candidatus Tectomicrobia bacterium]